VIVNRILTFVLLMACSTVFFGCSQVASYIPFFPRQSRTIDKASNTAPGGTDPQASASAELVERGKALLYGGSIDDAISTFERSLTLDPVNGRAYYYLSEAWLLKGNTIQAKEFNRLAGLHLAGDVSWSRPVIEQRERISQIRGEQRE